MGLDDLAAIRAADALIEKARQEADEEARVEAARTALDKLAEQGK